MKKVIKVKYFVLLLMPFLFGFNTEAADEWQSSWISHPDRESYSVLHFRNTFDLKEVPKNLELMISADIRYLLFVNDEYIP